MSLKRNSSCKIEALKHSVDVFPSTKENSFPSILHAESHTPWKHLLGGHFSLVRSLSPVTIGRGPTLTGKVKATSKRLFYPRFLCRRVLVTLGLSGAFLDPAGTHLCMNLDTRPRGKNSHFPVGVP